MVDPNFAAPVRGGTGANAGIGAQGAPALQRPTEDDFNAAQMAGLLGLMAKNKKPGEESAAPNAADTITPVVPTETPNIAPNGIPLPQGQMAVDNPIAGQQNIADAASGWGKDFNGNPIMISSPEAVQSAMSNFGNGMPTSTQAAANPGFLSWLGSFFGGGAGA
jgi:hypothetical protein